MQAGREALSVSLDVIQTRAAMCELCPAAVGSGEAARCREMVPGAMLAGTVRDPGAVCPRGRWPDGRGLVRWLRVLWIGVPWPVRVWLHARGRISHPDALPGCGCLYALKRLIGRGMIRAH